MSRQIDKKTTKQVRIDSGLHRLLKIEAAKSGETIKSLIEYALAELPSVDQVSIRTTKIEDEGKKK